MLSRALYGRKSEQQDKPGSEHKRGQQRGAPGHGRTQRPGLDERTEEHNPPPDACVCGRCGQPYAPNGAEESTLVEIEVKAYKRVIRRPRWRRTCACASSPMEVSAPPVPRLFPRTLYGTSFWARFLFEHCACFRPVHRVAAWMSAQGLTVSPGTLADSLKRFVPLLEPLAEAILAHQNKAALRHADETSWERQANWRKVAGESPAGRRSNQPLPPRVMGRHSRGCRLSVDRGAYGRGRLSYEKSENQGAEAFQYVEGNTASTAMVRGKWTLRSRRAQLHVRMLSRRDLGGLQVAP